MSKINRGGVALGGKVVAGTGLRKVPIANLTPLEGAVVSPTVEAYRLEIRNKQSIKPPDVVDLNGELLVVDGNNRVHAYKLEGHTDVDVNVKATGSQLKYYTSELAHALRRGRKGFAKMQGCADDDERAAFTVSEQAENESADWSAELLKMDVPE